MYSSEHLVELEWKINNISTSESLVPEDMTYYEYEDHSVSFKTKTHKRNVKIEEIISENDE